MAVIRFRIGKCRKSKTPKAQLRRPTRTKSSQETCTTARQPAVIDTPNPISDLSRLPIEIFHGIMYHLDVSSMLSVYHTCRDFRRKLHYELANYVWYKRLPPTILGKAERGLGRIDREHISCLGAKYTNLFNYCNEVEYYISEDKRCQNCLVKDSRSSPPRSKQWGRMLCALCVNSLGISRPELTRLVNSLHPQMTIAAFRNLGAVTPQKLLYRPSVDTIIRQRTGRGLADFELAAKDEWRSRTKALYQNHDLHEQHEILRRRLIDATQYIYTYLSVICRKSGKITDEEAKKPYQLLCDQLQMDDIELSCYMDAWFATSDTLDSTIMHILISRIGPNIIPFLFPAPFLNADAPHIAPETAVDDFLKQNLTPETLGRICRHEAVPQEYIVFDALRLLISLLDVNAKHYNTSRRQGNRPAWIEAMKRYHRANIHTDLTTGAIMNMSLHNAQPGTYNHRNNLTNRGIIILRQKLGLPAYPPLVTDFVRPDSFNQGNLICNPAFTHPDMSDNEKIMAVHSAYEAAEKKEKEMLLYFNKICYEACMRCPVTGDHLSKPGLEEMLEHVRWMHKEVFWYGSIWLLG